MRPSVIYLIQLLLCKNAFQTIISVIFFFSRHVIMPFWPLKTRCWQTQQFYLDVLILNWNYSQIFYLESFREPIKSLWIWANTMKCFYWIRKIIAFINYFIAPLNKWITHKLFSSVFSIFPGFFGKSKHFDQMVE